MQDRRILIVTTEPLIAALLAASLEIEHVEPVFPEPEELADQAAARVRPSAILIDMEHPDGNSDVFLARARRAGIGVVLFSSSRSPIEARQIARQRGLRWFVLPIAREELVQIVCEAIGPTANA